MFQVPPIKNGETLAAWRERLADHYSLSPKVEHIIREVSIQSYINGTKDMLDALNDRDGVGVNEY